MAFSGLYGLPIPWYERAVNTLSTALPGVLLFEPKKHGDNRGFFMETYHEKRYYECGLKETFVQDNISYSRRGVLRGLHFQNPNAQGKLVTVLQGEIFDVAVDIRLGSPTFGRSVSVSLSSDNNRQLWIPAQFAHGFCVVSETALVTYKCTALYAPECELSLLWNDPDLQIPWPLKDVSLSAKDQQGIRLKDFPKEKLPKLVR